MTQPEALRLADELAAMQPAYFTREVAAELRRLHRAVAAETERCAGICEAITWSGDGKWFAARIREGGHVSEP
jgi:hypothetical protein